MRPPFLPNPEISRAVLIGTSDFQHHDRLQNLPAVANNITDLAAALTDPRTGILTAESCQTVYTPESPRSLVQRLRRSAAQAEDVLLVYYAGHGKRHPVEDTLYLTVWETDPDDLETTAVPFPTFRSVIANSPARTKLLILDCCYSGLAVGTMSGTDVELEDVAVTGTSVITSAPKNKKALSPPGERHTAFTGELLRLLVSGSRLANQPLDVNQAYRSVRAALARRSLPEPKMSAGDTSGALVLRRTVASPALTPPAPKPPPREKPAPAPKPPRTGPPVPETALAESPRHELLKPGPPVPETPVPKTSLAETSVVEPPTSEPLKPGPPVAETRMAEPPRSGWPAPVASVAEIPVARVPAPEASVPESAASERVAAEVSALERADAKTAVTKPSAAERVAAERAARARAMAQRAAAEPPRCEPPASETGAIEAAPSLEVRSPGLQVWFAVTGWLLWVGVGFGASFGVGGIVGTLVESGPASSDLGTGIFMFAVGGVCGFFLAWRRRRARGRPFGLFDAFPQLAAKTALPRTIVLWFVFVISTIMSIAGPFTSNPAGAKATTVISAVVFLVEVAVASGYALFKRRTL